MQPTDKPTTNGEPAPLSLGALLRSLEGLRARDFDDLNLIELKAGEVLFRQGDPGGDYLYMLVAGALGVRVEQPDGGEAEIDRLAPGALVGEMAVLTGQTRTATIYALTDAGLLRFSRADLGRAMAEDEAAAAQIVAELAPRWQRLQLARVLGGIFGEIDAATLHGLQDRLEWRHLSNGDVLVRQGEPADGMYLVVSGRLRMVATDDAGEQKTLGEIGSGETVGEYALLTDETRSATVVAIRESTVVKLATAVFEQLAREEPAFMRNLARHIVARQQRAIRGVGRDPQAAMTLALLPLHDSVDAARFAGELAAALAPYGRTLNLTAARLDELYGQAGAAQMTAEDPAYPALVAWMTQQEIAYDVILYAAEPAWCAWTERCLSQADRVLLLADPGGDPQPGPAERHLATYETPVRTELVLWHPAAAERPVGTAAWLDGRTAAAHHHVRQGDGDHMRRLARRLTGQAIALVLSGGGARGFVHGGVYRALLELGIPIDYFGGTSMGALIAGLLAAGATYEDALTHTALVARRGQLFDYTLPLASLNRSAKVSGICRQLFGDLQIEDLWYPYFCIASNLTTAEPVVQQRGPLWLAVRASISIPGVFAPVNREGELLVDGGPMNNFPVDVMAELSESPRIIGVHASPHTVRRIDFDYETHVSGWRIMAGRLNPFGKRARYPSITGTMLRAMEVNNAHQARGREALADLVIYPDAREFGIMDFGAYGPIMDLGYQAALEPLRAWKARQAVL